MRQILAYEVLDDEHDKLCSIRIEDDHLVIQDDRQTQVKLYLNLDCDNIRKLAKALNYLADECDKYGEDDLRVELDSDDCDDDDCDDDDDHDGCGGCCDCEDCNCERYGESRISLDEKKILDSLSARLDKIEQKIK